MRNNRVCAEAMIVVVVVVLMVSAEKIGGETKKKAMPIDVGIILDLDTTVGKMARSIIPMALSDFYAVHNNYTTKIVPHFRDSMSDNVAAASAAIDLLKNVQVQAIIGPQRSTEADFVIDIGNRSNVPIISSATSPSLSPKDNPYFIRAAQNAASQAAPIAALIKAFGWREVVFIYEDSNFGGGFIPFLTDAMLNISTQVKYRSVLSPSASDEQVLEELYKLKNMQTRVFVVHTLAAFASRLFVKATEAGMMTEGYAWIITEVVTSLLHSLDPSVVNYMQGVLGVKPYIPRSKELKHFDYRWKKSFVRENPDMHRIELDMFGVWAYDSVFALATALERVANSTTTIQQYYTKPVRTRETLSTDLAAIGTSDMGPRLLPKIRNIKFIGLSGKFHVVGGELQSSGYQIVNVVGKGEKGIGFWNTESGFSRKYNDDHRGQGAYNYSSNKMDLGHITWPGDTPNVPKGWEFPTSSEKKLRVGIPDKGGFAEFIKVKIDPQTKEVKPEGFCIDVFEEVMNALPYAVPYEYVPFDTSTGNYTELVYQVYLQKYDAVVGDVTILANRSNYVDFTLPYTESGVSMIVPIKADDRKSPWIFLRPLSGGLWLTTGAFFIYTGIVVWVLEHRVNKEFRGLPYKQVGMIFWFSFSTLVFAHKEKMVSNLSRFVVIVWVFLVLVLTSSYTASLTSMLTVQKLRPEFADINDLMMRKWEHIGYQTSTFVRGMLEDEDRQFDGSRLKNYTTLEDYDEALSKGSKNGGVAVIVDEIPYIRLFLSKYCTKYTMVGPIYRTAGFGFAFPKGSPLVPDVSKAILQVTEKQMKRISYKWFGQGPECAEQDRSVLDSADRLTFESFMGLFIIVGGSLTLALIFFFLRFFYQNRALILSDHYSFREKLLKIIKTFNEEMDQDQSNKTSTTTKPTEAIDGVIPGHTSTSCDTVTPSPSSGNHAANEHHLLRNRKPPRASDDLPYHVSSEASADLPYQNSSETNDDPPQQNS